MKLEDKIQKRIKELQLCMERNVHLVETLYVMDLYHSIRKFWSALSEEDRDYLQAVNYAISEMIEWKLP
tara:strand:- start:149 stop:355 length:207 start_codon:yes stop_codon:yes gene_type:complete